VWPGVHEGRDGALWVSRDGIWKVFTDPYTEGIQVSVLSNDILDTDNHDTVSITLNTDL